MTRIAIVSPAPLLASGLAAALSAVPGWQVTVGDEITDAVAGPDVLVLHARDTAEALALHARLPPSLPAVMLGDDLREVAWRNAGDPRPLALLSSDAAAAGVCAAVAAVLQGLSVRDTTTGWHEATRSPAHGMAPDHEPLTPRELEVFELIGKGLSNRDIAGVLGISAHTAKFHVGQILAKVGAATRAEAVSTGLKLGVIGL